MKKSLFTIELKREVLVTDIIELMFSKLLWIVLAGIVVATGFTVGTKLFVTPMYKSFATMYIYTNPQSSQAGVINNSDLVAASNLAETYKHILTGNKVVEAVLTDVKTKNSVGETLTVKSIEKMTAVSKIEGTQLIMVEVTSSNPNLAKQIAESFTTVANEEIIRVFKAGGVEVVDHPEIPAGPSSPNIIRNGILGFLLGAVCVAFIILVMYLADDAIYTSEEIEKISDLPIIGTVPMIDATENKIKSFWNVSGERRIINGSKESKEKQD